MLDTRGRVQGTRQRLVERYKLSVIREIMSEDVMLNMVIIFASTVLYN